MLGDVIKEVHSSIIERVTSPLLGSFAVSWCLWNYKFILIVLSEEPVARSFELISTLAYPSAAHVWSKGVIGPLLTTLAYVFVYPYPAKWVFEYTRKRQREVLMIKRRIEEETPLTIEESRTLRTRMRNQEAEFVNEREGYLTEIAELKEMQNSVPEDSDAPGEDDHGPQSGGTITASQMAMLRQVTQGHFTREDLYGSSNNRVKREFDVGELEGMGLIELKWNGSTSDHRMKLTQEGRRVLLSAE